jgi:segregation and condensation protein B
MDKTYLSVIEALIFASEDSISADEIIKDIKDIDVVDIQMTASDVEKSVEELNNKYSEFNLSFRIVKIANGYLFATNPEFAKYIGYLSSEKSRRRLSQAALETLSIIAYKQPITKPNLEAIRGVNSDYILNTLLEKNLIRISGREETVGRPLLYTTTEEFLKYFGLNSIADLPKPREIEEIMKDEDFIEQKRKIMMNLLEEKIQSETETENETNEFDETE